MCQDETWESSSKSLRMKSRRFRLGSGARNGAHPAITARAITRLHRVERSEMITTFLLTGAWSSRAQVGRMPLKLNRWQQFSNEGRRILIKTLQDQVPKPAGGMTTDPIKQENATLGSIIRRLRGRTKKDPLTGKKRAPAGARRISLEGT